MTRKAERKPTAGEVFANISRLAAEAEWTGEEIDEALREEGIDPDELVRGVRQKLAEAGFPLPEEGCSNSCAPACERCGDTRRVNVGCAISRPVTLPCPDCSAR